MARFNLLGSLRAQPLLARGVKWTLLTTAVILCAHLAAAGTPPPGFTETQLVSNSSVTGASGPTAAAYEPGTDNLWVLEKGSGGSTATARVRVRDDASGAVSTALTLNCVDSRGERGLLGIAFAPDYATSRHVFLFYIRRITDSGTCSISGQSEASRMRISRFTESSLTLSGESVILQGPALTGATNHNGGTLRFAADGTLFISIGDNDTDANANPLSRDLGDLRGKILRINPDGTVPTDNPFVGQGGVEPEIWAWGLRNPFRFSIDTETGAPIIADVGEVKWEAIYVGVAGADYGYPCVEGSASFRTCNPAPAAGSVTAPIFEYGHGSETPPVSGNSITGGPVYYDDAFPEEYHGSYFFGDYVDDWIRRGRITPSGTLVDVELFASNTNGVVDIVVSPDGCLTWVGYNGDGVRQICYVGGSNEQPEAISSASPVSGLANLNVQFTGSGSSDPDLDPLLYSWDFDDGPDSTSADPSHLYTNNGIYDVVLTVDDQQGEVNSEDTAPALKIVVGNRSPTPAIATPAHQAPYTAGETISFSGSGSDPEDGSLANTRLSWTVVFHHDTHTHPFLGPITGVGSGQFDIADDGEDSTNVFYRLHLTATDSGSPLGAAGALSSSTFVDLVPAISELTLAATPGGFGLELEFDQQASQAPSSHDSVVAFPRTIGAPSPQNVGPWTFTFQSWSDAGAAEHTVATPAFDTTYTATFSATCSSPDNVSLMNDTVTGSETHDACVSITVGPAYTVESTGDLTLRAGTSIELGDGFAVEAGGTLTLATGGAP